MGENATVELTEAGRLALQIQLLNEIQAANMEGSFGYEPESTHFFWTDSMFVLHGLTPSPDNLIEISQANRFIHKEDMGLVLEQRAVVEQFGQADYYFRIVTSEGGIRRIHAREQKIVQNGAGRIRGFWQDERREREIQHALRERNEKQAMQLKVFERAEEVAQAGSWQINLETFETVYSDNVYRIYGLAPQSIPAHVDTFRKFIHPDDRAIVLRTQEKAYVEMIPLHLEYRIVREDGETRYVSQVSHLLKNEKGEQVLSGNTRDTTDQKLLEIQLKESNDLLSLYNELFIQAEQIGRLGTWQINLETRKSIYSDNAYRIFGLKPQSLTPSIDSFLQFIDPDDRQNLIDLNKKIFEEPAAFDVEFNIIRADGKPRTLRSKSKLVKSTTGESLMIGVMQDITEHKVKDIQLRENNEKLAVQNELLRLGEAIAGIGSWTWDLDTDEIIYSDNIYGIYGLKPQSATPGYESFGKFMHPEDRKWMKDMPEKIRTALTPMSIDYRIIRADGELRYLRGRNQPITSPEGHTVIIGTTQDITDEVLMKQQLLEKVRFAEMLGDTMVDRIVVTDTANNVIGWNKSCERIYSRQRDEVIGRNIFDVFPQIRTQTVMDRFKRALGGETIHVPVQPSAEAPGYQELFMVPFRDEQGAVMGVLHVLHDVTMQQQLQEELSTRLQFIEKLLESSVDRIMVLDKDLHFQLWNKRCEEYYGLAKQDVEKRNILEIFPRFKTDPLYQHCLQVLEGETVYVPANERSGLTGYQESYFIPLKNESKEVTGVLWIMHDLTERFIAEEKLRSSESQLRAAQEIAVTGSFEADLLTGEMKWSDQTYAIFGYATGLEMNIAKAEKRIYEEDLPAFYDIFNVQERTPGDIFDAYFRLDMGEGHIKYIHCRNQVIGNNDGRRVRVIGAMQDITEMKLAQDEIVKQQELLKQAEAIAHVGSWELDIATNAMRWSDEIFRMYGYAPQAFDPDLQFYLKTIHPNDRPQLKQAIHKAASEHRLFTLTCRIFTLDGDLRHLEIRGRGLTDAFGKFSRVVGTMQDATVHKQMAEELRKKNDGIWFQYQMDRQTDKFKNTGSWLWEINQDKVIWGENLYRLFGLTPDVYQPTIDFLAGFAHEEDKDRVHDMISSVHHRKDGMLPDFEYRIVLDGNVRFLRASARLVSGKDKRTLVGSLMDITEDALLRQQLSEKIAQHIKAEQELHDLNESLQQKNKQLEDANEELTSFAFVASHDLREPLRKIQIFSDWLCQKEASNLSPEGADRFRRIQAAVSRMDVLIDDILSFSHVNTDQRIFTVVDMDKVMENVKGDLHEVIAETQAVIESGELPEVVGNESHLTQLLQNLLSNALKYRQKDIAPRISVTATYIAGDALHHSSADPSLQYARISVADNGIGFDQQYAKKIFQMFQRLHGMHDYQGTGMGLAICKKIVEHHGGFMIATGQPGVGSQFDCYLPLHNG